MNDPKPHTQGEAESVVRTRVEQFLAVYRFMPAPAKAQLEAELEAHLKTEDPRTQNLYRALFAAARAGRDVNGAIEALVKVDQTEGTSPSL